MLDLYVLSFQSVHILPSTDPVAVSKELNHLLDRLFVVRLIVLAPGFQFRTRPEGLSPALPVHDHVSLGLEGFDEVTDCSALPDMR